MTGKTILVVEDNAIQREGLAVILHLEGYTALLAANGEEGLSWLRSEPTPDLILLDMMIPKHKADGWYFLERRKHIPVAASVPIIITTGIGNASDEWAVALGACCLLRKPVEPEHLLNEIKRCLGA
jgi:CheY-like chemotaxis protein